MLPLPPDHFRIKPHSPDVFFYLLVEPSAVSVIAGCWLKIRQLTYPEAVKKLHEQLPQVLTEHGGQCNRQLLVFGFHQELHLHVPPAVINTICAVAVVFVEYLELTTSENLLQFIQIPRPPTLAVNDDEHVLTFRQHPETHEKAAEYVKGGYRFVVGGLYEPIKLAFQYNLRLHRQGTADAGLIHLDGQTVTAEIDGGLRDCAWQAKWTVTVPRARGHRRKHLRTNTLEQFGQACGLGAATGQHGQHAAFQIDNAAFFSAGIELLAIGKGDFAGSFGYLAADGG